MHLADEQAYTLSATPYLDGDVAWCGATKTEGLTAFVDGDQDKVGDSRDLCGTVGGADGAHPGCPVLPQVVTARIEGDTLVGAVTATGAVGGACPRPWCTWTVWATRARRFG